MPIDPSATVPKALGLSWGMTRAACASALGRRPVRASKGRGAGFQTYAASKDGRRPELTLLFDSAGGLWGVERTLYQSRDFWDGDWTPKEVRALTAKAAAVYRDAVAQSTEHLGSPTFAGKYGGAGYPDDATERKLRFWDRPKARWVVTQDQADRELPIIVAAAWRSPRPRDAAADRREQRPRNSEDRQFYDSLGNEDPAKRCRHDGCPRGTVKMSAFCRRHHFESITGKKCRYRD